MAVYTVNGDGVAWRIVDGEAVIINTETTHYYSLNRTGTHVWALLVDEARSLEEIVADVSATYGMREDEVVDDVRRILDDLMGEDLIIAQE